MNYDEEGHLWEINGFMSARTHAIGLSSMRSDVTYEGNVTYVCGHPSGRTRKRVLLRMRAEIVEVLQRTAALILRSSRAMRASVSKDGRTRHL